MSADNISDWRTLVETFVHRNGNLNFVSPVPLESNEEPVNRDSSMVIDCNRCPSGERTIRQSCPQIRNDRLSIYNSELRGSVSHSSPSPPATMCVSSRLDNSSTFEPVQTSLSNSSTTSDNSPPYDTIGRYSYTGSDSEMRDSLNNYDISDTNGTPLGQPPLKRFKSHHRPSTFSWSLRAQNSRHEFVQDEEYDDLGVVPLGEVFCPRASSTPISSPTMAHVFRDSQTMDFWAKGDSHARRRLDFRDEGEEAVYHLVTKYNLDDNGWRCN